MDTSTLLQEISKVLNQFKQAVFGLLPKVIGAALILLIGFIVARVIRALIWRFIDRLHLLIPHQRIRASVKSYFDEKPVARVIGSIFYWLLIFLFLTVATETLGLPVVTTWLSGIVGYLPKVLMAALIGIAGIVGGIMLRDFITSAALSSGITYGRMLGVVTQMLVLLITLLIAIEQIGIDVSLLKSVFVAAVGASFLGAALAFGIGARSSVSNILASHYLQRIYKVGDEIRVDGQEGRIVTITPLAVIIDSTEGQACVPAQAFNEASSVLLVRENRDEL